MPVGDTPPQGAPGQVTTRATFLGPIHAKVVNVVDGPFGAQDVAHNGERLVVQLDGVVVEAVFDTHPFLTLVEIADDFTSEALGDLTAERHTSTEEAHDVGAAERGHGVLQQSGVEAAQLGGLAEDDVDGPLALIRRPVVGRRMSSKDLVVNGIQRLSDAVQYSRPDDSEL